ncbi:MAG: YfhO family protein, partial [Bacteroidales bacterium]|nr:YfhO family protein [Bacteroidales bacterium]
EMQAFIEKVQVAKTIEGVDSALQVFNVLNMLNTKYLILNPESEALKNVYAQGHAWFVKDIHWVSNADEEILALDSVDLRSIAVVDQRFKTEVMALSADSVETGSIELMSYAPNKLEYKSVSSSDRCAVFSEIYYPEGWSATVDGQPVSIFRANYMLRALVVPAGEHVVTFQYRPDAYFQGSRYSGIASSLLILALLGAAGFYYRSEKYKKECPSSQS